MARNDRMSKRSTTRATAAVALAAAFALAACGGKEKGAEAPAAGDGQLAADTSGAAASEPAGDRDAPGEGAASAAEEKRAHCVRAIEHVMALVQERGAEITDEQRAEALGEGADQCARDASRAELDCVLAAGDVDEIEACEGGGA
jgi:hypothetical protein